MPFYESHLLFHKYPIGKPVPLPTGQEHLIELPRYRNGNQRQLRLLDDNHASIVEIDILSNTFREHAYLTGDTFNQMGMVTRKRGRFVSRRIFWNDT